MSSSKSDRDYYGEVEQLKLNQKYDVDEEESWISGEELITEESTDEEDVKCKGKSSKPKSSRGKKWSSKPTTLPPINRENMSMSSATSGRSGMASMASSDVNFNDEEAPSWRPKRGSIKLSDLEGYQLVQMQENQPSDDLNSHGDGCQEYSNNICALSLEFLKDIELNDLTDILKKYLNEDEISTCEYLSDDKQCLEDARDFGGIYSDLVNKDPSLNDVLVEMNNLDKILNEKTENANKFLNDGKSKTAGKHVRVAKCYKNIHLSNPRKMGRPESSSIVKNKKKSSIRMVKSANDNLQDVKLLGQDNNSNPIKLTEDEAKRIEEILANKDHENEENIKFNPGEGFTLSSEDCLTLESIDSKLEAIYAQQSASQRTVGESVDAELSKLKMCHESELLNSIDSKLEILQRNKNNNEISVSDNELNRLLQSIRGESPKSRVSESRTSGNSSETDTLSDEKESSIKSNLDAVSSD